MAMMPMHIEAGWKAPIKDEYKEIVKASGEPSEFEEVERFAFYEQAKKAYCVVATGEGALYANLIVRALCVSLVPAAKPNPDLALISPLLLSPLLSAQEGRDRQQVRSAG